MTEPTLVALVTAAIAAIPPTLMAWGAFRQSQKNATKAEANNVIADAKADAIHGLANGNLAKISTELQLARQEIDGLKALVNALMKKQGEAGPQGPPGEVGPRGEAGPKGKLF
jgi:hypothetical protein